MHLKDKNICPLCRSWKKVVSKVSVEFILIVYILIGMYKQYQTWRYKATVVAYKAKLHHIINKLHCFVMLADALTEIC